MSKYITARDKTGLGLRLCWRSGEIESVVLEDATPKEPGDRSRNSDGIHVRLGIQVVATRTWERLNIEAELQAVERALQRQDQPLINKTMKALAARVIECAADGQVLVVDTASAWALGQSTAKEYGDALRRSRTMPAKLISRLKGEAEAANVAIRNPDWAVFGNHVLVAMGLKPARLGRSVSKKTAATDRDEGAEADSEAGDADEEFGVSAEAFPEEFPDEIA